MVECSKNNSAFLSYLRKNDNFCNKSSLIKSFISNSENSFEVLALLKNCAIHNICVVLSKNGHVIDVNQEKGIAFKDEITY
jgi:hypothetical protein